MYPVTNAVAALFDAEQRQILEITGEDVNGNPIAITDTDIMQGSFSIDRYSCNGSRLEIGTAISAEMSVKLDNSDGRFNDVQFEGAELFVRIGIADWAQTNPTISWIPCGYFTCDDQPRRRTIITLSALDRMMKFDDIPPVLTPWTTETGEYMTNELGNKLYFCAELAFPCTVSELVEQICLRCGVDITTDLTTLPNYNIVIPTPPQVEGDITFRNLIQWCAGLMASNAYMDWAGKLCFSWYTNTGYNSTPDRRYSSDMHENDITITGVKFEDADNNVYIAGTTVYPLDISGNALVDTDVISTILQNIFRVVNGFKYRPFEAEAVAAPWLWPMDRVTFTDAEGNGHVSALTNVNLTVNGKTGISGIGETVKTKSYAAPSGLTTAQRMAFENVKRVNSEAISEAVDNATAQITGAKDGYLRDLFDENGNRIGDVLMDTNDVNTATKVWKRNMGGFGYSRNGIDGPYTLAITQDGAIVADFITTGTMSADRIEAGTISISKLTDEAQESLVVSSSTKTQYYISTSSTTLHGGAWADMPQWVTGRYVWTREVVSQTHANGQTVVSYLPDANGQYDYNLTTALQTADTAASDVSSAASEIQTVYHSAASGAIVTVPSGWVANNTGNQNVWTTVRPVYNAAYPVLYVANQRKSMAGTITCTTPAIDETTTVIDGGHITTGTIDANRIRAGVIQDLAGRNSWNLTTGAMEFQGEFSTSVTVRKEESPGVYVDVTYVMRLDEGKLKFYEDDDLLGYINFMSDGIELATLGWNNAGITAYDTNGTLKASAKVLPYGTVVLTCDTLSIGNVGQVPYNTGITGSYNGLVFKNGICVGYD